MIRKNLRFKFVRMHNFVDLGFSTQIKPAWNREKPVSVTNDTKETGICNSSTADFSN